MFPEINPGRAAAAVLPQMAGAAAAGRPAGANRPTPHMPPLDSVRIFSEPGSKSRNCNSALVGGVSARCLRRWKERGQLRAIGKGARASSGMQLH